MKQYKALILQNGNNAPEVSIIKNEIDGCQYQYNSVGFYQCNGSFPEGKTSVHISSCVEDAYPTANWVDDGTIEIMVRRLPSAERTDNALRAFFLIEIEE